MNKEKQIKLIERLSLGRYKVVNGVVYSFDKALTGKVVDDKYMYFKIYGGRGVGAPMYVYGHDLAWISSFGIIPPGKRVAFKDGNRMNFRLENLELVSTRSGMKFGNRRIRHDDIWSIKFYLKGGERNASKIAKELQLGEQAVRYTIKKLEAGEPLKYEDSDTVTSCNNKMPKQQSVYDNKQ
jgi:hypothetical protein